MTQTFLTKDYRKRRKDVLLDREKSLLPQTQPDVERELAERARKKLLNEMIVEKQELSRRLRDLNIAIDDIRYGDDIERVELPGVITTRKCPVDECRGFLSSQWKCGICETQICKDCNEPKGEDHECDPNNVETMKLLKKDSKPCPSCGTLITKIDGCDQMWCTQPSCHTAFSWRSGRKVFGVIHNPHFIQFSMANGVAERDPQDVPCGGLPDMYSYFSRIRNTLHRLHHDRFSFPIRFIRHLTHVEEQRYRVEDVVHTNSDLRVRYLLNEIDENFLASSIIKRDTCRKKKKAFHDIIVMMIHTGTDIINVIHNNLLERNINEIFNQVIVLDNLREYANQQFQRVGTIYKCKYPRITQTWEYERYC
jgi:hypothetical protein